MPSPMPRPAPAFAFALAATLLVTGDPAKAQRFDVNGDFDTDLSGWSVDIPDVTSWSPLDVDARAGSGSVRLVSTDPDPGIRLIALRQCVTLTQTGRYLLGASGRVDGAALGRMVFSYIGRARDTCTGSAFSLGGRFLGAGGDWQSIDAVVSVAQVPTTIEVLLSIEKDVAGGSLGGNIDSIYILRDLRILRDGFE